VYKPYPEIQVVFLNTKPNAYPGIMLDNAGVHIPCTKEGKCRDFMCSSKDDKISLVGYTNKTKKMKRAK